MQEDECKVSIITVVYNGVETIEQTILSVLAQTYKNIEYIIIDGLSTDGTLQVIKKYSSVISHFVSEKDNGLYDAMNKGIALSTGEIIGIINSDDWYAPDAVEKVVEYFRYHSVDLVYGRVFWVNQDNSQILAPAFPLETLWHRMAVPHPSVFIKKEIYDRFGVFSLDYQLSADYELMLRLYSHQVKFGFIDTVLAYFRFGGLSERLRRKSIEEVNAIFEKYSVICPDKEFNRMKLKDLCDLEYFYLALNERKNILSDVLKLYFKKEKITLIIFGTGKVGKMCYELLKEEDKDIELLSFMDNNPKKWNQMLNGIPVANPEELNNLEAQVLIAVKFEDEEIKQQLETINNKKIEFVCLKDLKDTYISNRNIWEQ